MLDSVAHVIGFIVGFFIGEYIKLLIAVLFNFIFIFAPIDFYCFFLKKEPVKPHKAKLVCICLCIFTCLWHLVGAVATNDYNIFVPIVSIIFGIEAYRKLTRM